MSKSFLARLPLAANVVDRDYGTRENEAAIAALLEHVDTRFLVLHEGRALLASSTSLALLPQAPRAELLVYLGRSLVDGTALFVAVVAEAEGISGTDGTDGVDNTDNTDNTDGTNGEWGDLRTLGDSLSHHDAGIFVEALAITNWHTGSRFSPLSGAATKPTKGGWVLVDPANGTELFPRTDLAVIVGVVDSDDRLLLGSNVRWEGDRYSLLAGFVEPGETLEAAVAREVFEESGVRVTNPRYLGSQPWPFPASLMIGFMATVDEAAQTDLTPDGVEIVDLRWFSRAELHAALGEITLPGPMSIARAIIEEWYGGPLEEAP